MRVITFAIAAFLVVALERSLVDVLMIHPLGGIRPSIAATLMVFVALFAPRHIALWCAWILGLLLDLAFPIQTSGGSPLYLPGPHALGFTLAAYGVIQLRPMVFRRRVLTLALLTLGALVIAGIVAVAIITIRTWYPGAEPLAAHATGLERLMWAFGTAVYSALVAIPVGFILYASLPAWNFYHAGPRSANVR